MSDKEDKNNKSNVGGEKPPITSAHEREKEKAKKTGIVAIAACACVAIIGGAAYLNVSNPDQLKDDVQSSSGVVTNNPENSSNSASPAPEASDSGELVTPTNVGKFNGLPVPAKPKNDDTIRVDMFFDPLCPACGAVDRKLSGKIQEMVDKGEIQVFLHPVSFLDKSSTDNYSTRAANALVNVYEKSPEVALKFMSEMYEEGFQPHEGFRYTSVPDSKLVELAKKVGLNESQASKVTEPTYNAWIEKATKESFKYKGLFPQGLATPGIFFALQDIDGFAIAINFVPQSEEYDSDFKIQRDKVAEYMKENKGSLQEEARRAVEDMKKREQAAANPGQQNAPDPQRGDEKSPKDNEGQASPQPPQDSPEGNPAAPAPNGPKNNADSAPVKP